MGARGKDRQGREFDLESMVETRGASVRRARAHESTTPVSAETSSSPEDGGNSRPLRTALICSESSLVDHRLLAAQLPPGWSELTGILLMRQNSPRQRGARFRHEWKRSGWRLLDVLAFRVFYKLRVAARDRAWILDEDDRGARAAAGSAGPFPSMRRTTRTPKLLVSSSRRWAPMRRSLPARRFSDLSLCDPRPGDLCLHRVSARNTEMLTGASGRLRVGISLGRRDLASHRRRRRHGAGLCLLRGRVRRPRGLACDGPVSGRVRPPAVSLGGHERACAGELAPLDVSGRTSRAWGQPRLSDYARWKLAARRNPFVTILLVSRRRREAGCRLRWLSRPARGPLQARARTLRGTPGCNCVHRSRGGTSARACRTEIACFRAPEPSLRSTMEGRPHTT